MPLNISKVGKILKELNRVSDVNEFNATLPVKIKVLKEINPIRYLIKLGNKEVETKSSFKLETGKEYFAQIKDIKSKINISNLREIPKILTLLKKSVQINEKENIIHFDKQTLLKHLANSNSKTEFIFFTNILLALNQNIHHLIINNKKKAIMQYKYVKNRVKFYAVFEHLAELEGEISPDSLKIYSPYSATIELINIYKHELDLNVIIEKKDPEELFAFSNNLLNLKA